MGIWYKSRIPMIFCFIGNFVTYKAKLSGGSHCGGMELCR